MADLNAAEFIQPIQPTRRITKQESAVWNRVTSAWPKDHWIASDAELLTHYCAICVHLDRFMKAGDTSNIDRLAKLVLQYATKLRITPQSRYNTQMAGREAERGRDNEAADDALLGGSVWSSAVPN